MNEQKDFRRKFIQQHLNMIKQKKVTIQYTPWEIEFISNIRSLVEKGYWELSEKQYNTLKFLAEKEEG